MAPTRKSRVIHPRYKRSEDSPDKEGQTTKSKTKKRKLSDMLGSQWSKEELERFYLAYRKHGKDWKKVAGVIRNRNADMVEALYNMNRAYLSLPEGTATVAGLIAMMTDHYNILEGSDSDDEGNDEPQTSSKPLKRAHGKFSPGKVPATSHHDFLQQQSTTANYGCLSLLKKKRSGGSRPRAVGKRTPRFPVPYARVREDSNLGSSLHKFIKSERDADEDGVHVAALALAEASQRAGSPQVSRTPLRTEHSKSSPIQSGERKYVELEANWKNGYGSEGSRGSVEAETGDFAVETGHHQNSENGHAFENKKKLRKTKGSNSKPLGFESNMLDDDVREACSGTEEGPSNRGSKAEFDSEASERKRAQIFQGSRKRNRQLFSGDESTALDALQALADLSFNILAPGSTAESDSSVQPKDDKKSVNVAEKSTPTEMTGKGKKDKPKGPKRKPGPLLGTRRSSKQRELSADAKNSSEAKNHQPVRRTRKKEPKNLKSEENEDTCPAESPLLEAIVEESKKPVNKVKGGTHGPSHKLAKMMKPPEPVSSGSEISRKPTDENDSTGQIPSENKVFLTTKHRNRRKMHLKRTLAQALMKFSTVLQEGRSDMCLASDTASKIKAKLSNCLSSPLQRRWCMFEWFYSAIDYPWFAKSEFVEYLDHVGLGHVPRLTRVEWGVIRSSLGKPRRLSTQFLQEERGKLENYRESVRLHYAELRSGIREGLPADLARPLSVGQRVIACHPKTREIHDGSILTVDRSRCRVQFDRPELGVEFVMDIDCMPLNPLENMPDALRKKNLMMEKISGAFYETRKLSQPQDRRFGDSLMLLPSENGDNAEGICNFAPSNFPMNTLMKQGDTIDAIAVAKAAANEATAVAQQAMYSQPCTLAQIQAREADIRALAELTRALDKKEALLIELKNMNEEVAAKQKDGEPIKEFDHFRKQYAMVLLQLRDANDQVANALLFLRQRNTYQGNSESLCAQAGLDHSVGSTGHHGQFGHPAFPFQEPRSHILDIIEGARRKARAMVDVATTAMSSVKEGEDAFARIGEALDSAKGWTRGIESGQSVQDQTAKVEQSSSPRRASSDSTNGIECWLPNDLISSCVATLIMIQTCAERQDPPADVAQILDSAVTTMEPCCPQNLPIYREIEAFMGIVKNQMLAKVPSLSTSLPTSELHTS